MKKLKYNELPPLKQGTACPECGKVLEESDPAPWEGSHYEYQFRQQGGRYKPVSHQDQKECLRYLRSVVDELVNDLKSVQRDVELLDCPRKYSG